MAGFIFQGKEMLYLQNIRESQTLFIPKNEEGVHGSLTLQLRNTIDLVTSVNGMVDLGTSALYYNLAISLPEGMEEGEYEYTLLDGGETLASGILHVGEASSAKQYEKSIEYEQYRSE